MAHRCIRFRLPRLGNLPPWEFDKGGQRVNMQVPAPLVVNSAQLALAAVRAGIGLGWFSADAIAGDVAAGRLRAVLADWCPSFAGYHLYSPSRSLPSPAFARLLAALRAHRAA